MKINNTDDIKNIFIEKGLINDKYGFVISAIECKRFNCCIKDFVFITGLQPPDGLDYKVDTPNKFIIPDGCFAHVTFTHELSTFTAKSWYRGIIPLTYSGLENLIDSSTFKLVYKLCFEDNESLPNIALCQELSHLTDDCFEYY